MLGLHATQPLLHSNISVCTPPPGADLALFTVVADISILTLNLSLMINTVSFYQV